MSNASGARRPGRFAADRHHHNEPPTHPPGRSSRSRGRLAAESPGSPGGACHCDFFLFFFARAYIVRALACMRACLRACLRASVRACGACVRVCVSEVNGNSTGGGGRDDEGAGGYCSARVCTSSVRAHKALDHHRFRERDPIEHFAKAIALLKT